jgi:hypothetical protein
MESQIYRRKLFGNLLVLASFAILFTTSIANAQLVLKLTLLEGPIISPQSRRSAEPDQYDKSISIGEPVFIRIEMYDESLSMTELIPSLDPAVGAVSMQVTDPSGDSSSIICRRWEIADIYIQKRSLEPNEHLFFETYLYGHMKKVADDYSHEYLFPFSGIYTMTTQYSMADPQIEVTSNPVSITVGSPLPEWSSLQGAGVVDFMEGRSHTNKVRAEQVLRIGQLSEKIPGHPFKPWLDKASGVVGQAVRPIDSDDMEAIEEVVKDFISAWAAGDANDARRFLSDDFTYNAALGGQDLLDMIDIRKSGTFLNIELIELSAEYEIEDILATVQLMVSSADDPKARQQVIRFSLRRDRNSWLIFRWDRLSP